MKKNRDRRKLRKSGIIHSLADPAFALRDQLRRRSGASGYHKSPKQYDRRDQSWRDEQKM